MIKYSVETNCRFASLALSDDDEDRTHVEVDHSKSKDSKDFHSNEKSVKINDSTINERGTDSARGRGRSPRMARGTGRGAARNVGSSGGSFATGEAPSRGGGAPRGRGRPLRNREMDRHSGSTRTGVKPVAKKDGYGAGNWGTVQDEMEVTVNNESKKVDSDNREESGNEENTAPVEPPVKTYSEYKALREKEVNKTTLSVRQPNDGKNVFDKMVIKRTVKKTEESTEPTQKMNLEANEEEVPISFECVEEIGSYNNRKEYNSQNRNYESRGGRGGRGRGGARGGRGEGRVGGPRIPVPSIADVHDFPALA